MDINLSYSLVYAAEAGGYGFAMTRERANVTEALDYHSQYALLRGRYLQLREYEKEHNPGLQIEMDSPGDDTTAIVMEGDLDKKGDDFFLGRYKQRYFILRENSQLEYFLENPKNNEKAKRRGIINLAIVSRIEKFKSPERKFGFNLYTKTSDGRVYWLSAVSEELREQWMHDIQKQIDNIETHHFKYGITKIARMREKRRRESSKTLCRRRSRFSGFRKQSKKEKLPSYISPHMSSSESEYEDEGANSRIFNMQSPKDTLLCLPSSRSLTFYNQEEKRNISDLKRPRGPSKIEKMDALATLFVELKIDLKFLDAFRREEMDAMDVPLLSEDELEEILPPIGPRARLVDRCTRLRDRSISTQIPVRYDNLSEVFEELKISQEHLDTCYNHEIAPSDLHLLKDDTLKTLVPPLGPRVRILDYAARTRELYQIDGNQSEFSETKGEIKEEKIDHNHVLRELENEHQLQRVGSIHSSFASVTAGSFRAISTPLIHGAVNFPTYKTVQTVKLVQTPLQSPRNNNQTQQQQHYSKHSQLKNIKGFPKSSISKTVPSIRRSISNPPEKSGATPESPPFLETLSSSFASQKSDDSSTVPDLETQTNSTSGTRKPSESVSSSDSDENDTKQPKKVRNMPNVGDKTKSLNSAPVRGASGRTSKLVAFFESERDPTPPGPSEGLQGLFTSMKKMFNGDMWRRKDSGNSSGESGSQEDGEIERTEEGSSKIK